MQAATHEDVAMLEEQASAANGRRPKGNFVEFHKRAVKDELLTHGGRVPLEGRTEEEVKRLEAEGAKHVNILNAEGRSVPHLEVPAAGRVRCKPVVYVRIHTPGDRLNIVDRPATADDFRAYPRQYRAFMEEKSQDADGTPLSSWAGVDPERVEEYRYAGVRTVEQLAAVHDGNAASMGPGTLTERQRARDYIQLMKGAAPTLELRRELEERDNTISVMQRQLKELGDRLEKQEKGKAKP